MSKTIPVADARVTLLPELRRGRSGLSTGQYRPHIVLGPQSQRLAIRDGNRIVEEYLGVMFFGGLDKMDPGDTAEVKLALMYAPELPYTNVRPGATFTLREGPEIVGYGVILSRGEESLPLPLRPVVSSPAVNK
jgi:hypothetical protein